MFYQYENHSGFLRDSKPVCLTSWSLPTSVCLLPKLYIAKFDPLFSNFVNKEWFTHFLRIVGTRIISDTVNYYPNYVPQPINILKIFLSIIYVSSQLLSRRIFSKCLIGSFDKHFSDMSAVSVIQVKLSYRIIHGREPSGQVSSITGSDSFTVL